MGRERGSCQVELAGVDVCAHDDAVGRASRQQCSHVATAAADVETPRGRRDREPIKEPDRGRQESP
jgi:hypothetical protein